MTMDRNQTLSLVNKYKDTRHQIDRHIFGIKKTLESNGEYVIAFFYIKLVEKLQEEIQGQLRKAYLKMLKDSQLTFQECREVFGGKN